MCRVLYELMSIVEPINIVDPKVFPSKILMITNYNKIY